MLSNALDDECTGRSPCHDCKWHLQGLDKNQCVDQCERLAAYRNGEPWEGLDVPFLYSYLCEHGEKKPDLTILRRSGKEIIEMEETSVIPADTKIQEKRQYHKTTVQVRELLNEKAGGKCLIDTCEAEYGLVRGLCTKHYQAWRKGYIKHPILGEFTVCQAKSRRRSEAKGTAGVFKESADQGKKIRVEIIPTEETSDQPSTQSSAAPGKPEVDESIMKTLPALQPRAGRKASPVKKEKQMSKDSKASYYDAGGIETLDIIKAKLTPEQYKGYLLGCSLKYQCRLMHKFDDKDRIRDAEKAANYSLWLVEAFKD